MVVVGATTRRELVFSLLNSRPVVAYMDLAHAPVTHG